MFPADEIAMKKQSAIKFLLAIVGASLIGSGCTVTYHPPVVAVDATVPAPVEVEATSAPPPPIDETVTVAPDPSFVWIGGVWVWGGGGWRWEGGHWDRPPHPGAVWMPHHYEFRNGRHVFVRGGWR
jgi:hypothetical protein